MVGWTFLLMALIMLAANLALARVINKIEKQRRIPGASFQQEKRNLLIILLFFELSYAARFGFDTFQDRFRHNTFVYLLVYDFVIQLDGLSFFALLLVHYKNFI